MAKTNPTQAAEDVLLESSRPLIAAKNAEIRYLLLHRFRTVGVLLICMCTHTVQLGHSTYIK
jgi:hypothetical protein